jgi:hypothetical protein
MKNLSVSQKRQIAKLAVEKSETIENGRMQVWVDGFEFSILINGEYRDEKHEHVCTLEVWSESKPYSQAAFMRQIENYLNA